MQIFLPFPNIYKSLSVLDKKRCQKQTLEAFQILNVILNYNDKRAWAHHPAVLMVKDYPNFLIKYYNISLLISKQKHLVNYVKLNFLPYINNLKIVYPKWFGNEKFHNSHKSNLARKDPVFYKDFLEEVGSELPYFWPSKERY